MSAILGLCLTQSLLTVLEVPMQRVTFYSDSTHVLGWIQERGKDFQPFAVNRIGKIQMFTKPSVAACIYRGESSQLVHKRCNPFRVSWVFLVVEWPQLVNKGFQ